MNHKKLTMQAFGITIFFSLAMGCSSVDEDSLPVAVDENAAVFDITINSGELTGDMDILRIKKNENVTLNFSSDSDITVHLHGYDIEKTVSSGNDQTMEFKANATGRFVITSHKNKTGHEDHGSHSGHSGTKTNVDAHAALFESETLTSGGTFSYQVPLNIENTIIPYHDHMSHGSGGSIEVSSDHGKSGDVLVIVGSGDHQFHPDNVIVKPGVLVQWKIDSTEKVRLTSGLPPTGHSDHSTDTEMGRANNESEEKTLIVLEVYP